MATRLYYTTTAGYFQPPLSGLPVTPDALQKLNNQMLPALSLTRPGHGVLQRSVGSVLTATVAGGTSVAQWQWATPPLDAQTIDGTVKGQMMAYELLSSQNLMPELWIHLIGSDWAYKSTLLGSSAGGAVTASEFATAGLTNRKFPTGGAVALTSQSADAGDRILVTVGYKAFSNYPVAGGGIGTMELMSAASSDLPEDETSTTSAAPWIEFSDDITFQADVFPAVPSNGYSLHGDNLQAVIAELGGGSGDGPAVVPTTGQTWPRVG